LYQTVDFCLNGGLDKQRFFKACHSGSGRHQLLLWGCAFVSLSNAKHVSNSGIVILRSQKSGIRVNNLFRNSAELRAMIAERVRAGLRWAKDEGKRLGRPRIAPELEKRILAALNERKRTGEGVREIAKRFGVDPSTVQRISRPFAAAAA
jgi:hypothetical protein